MGQAGAAGLGVPNCNSGSVMMRTFVLAFLLPFAMGMGSALPALGEDMDEGAMNFAMHDAVYTTYHEIGHLFVSEFELPVLGKEEDAADALAAVELLGPDAAEDASDVLVDAADGWYFNAVKTTGSGVDDLSYFDDHSLDIQRAYAMVCMMVGADPDWYGEVADAYDMDAERQEDCAGVYEQAAIAWASMLEPYLADGTEGERVTVVYDDTEDYAAFRDELEKRGILEAAAAQIESKYVLPRPITFRATECEEANAYFSAEDAEITYCYELAQSMYDMYLSDMAE